MTASNDPLGAFSSQGGIPHLMQYLWMKYSQEVAEQVQNRKEARKATLETDVALSKASAKMFIAWATKFLNANRVVENFFVDDNHGLRLVNNDYVVVSPGVDLRGTMQNSGAIGVTEGRSQPGNEGVVQVNDALRIT